MSLVPTQPQVNTSFNQTNGGFGTFTNARTNLYWPYPTGGSLSIFCSWQCTGSISGGNWNGSFVSYSPTLTSTVFNNQTASGGVNGSFTFTTPLPTSGSFFVRSNQSVVGNSSSGLVNGTTTTQPQFTIYMVGVTSSVTTFSGTYNSGTNIVLARLPLASTVIGQIYYVINWGINNFAGVCSFNGETIDGFTGSVAIPQWGCIGLTPNSTGSAWYIVSYYAGNMPPTNTNSVNGTTITSSVVTSFNDGSKTMILPNPATWGKGRMLFVNTYQTVTTSRVFQFAIYTNGFFRQNTTANMYFSLVPSPDLQGLHDHNRSMMFISDGTWWYIAGIFDGSGCIFDTAVTIGNNLTTGRIGIVTSSKDACFVCAPPPASSLNANLYYAKLGITTTHSYGMILTNNANAGLYGYQGSTNWNRMYKSGNPNYSGFTVIQATIPNASGSGTAAATINFAVSMYPSAY
jgi:hypothetical protein